MHMFILVALAMAQSEGAAPAVEINPVRGSVHVIDGAVDRIGVSAGSDGVLMVDVGYPHTLTAVKAAIASLDRGEPKIVINTHTHHAFANEGFADAQIIAHENVTARLARPRYMFNQSLAPSTPSALPDTSFQESHGLRFNGETIDILRLPAGHTDGDAIVIFRDSNVVFTGDAFVPHLTWIDYAAGGSLEGYLAALNFLVEVVPPDAILVPGHGETSRYEDLLAVRDAVRAGVELVRTGMEAGRSLTDLQRVGLPDELAKWTKGGVSAGLFIESVYKGLNTAHAGTCEFLNGYWFNGGAFERQPGFYAVDGVLTRRRPPVVECTVDLGDRFVVPPFADAHTHQLSNASEFADSSAAWLGQGIFYAMVQDPIQQIGPELRTASAARNTVDAVYTQGVITSSWNFIADLYGDLMRQGLFGANATIEDVEGSHYFAIDKAADLDREWPNILAGNDRFLKVITAFSEEFDKRRNNPAYQGTSKPGLDPALLPVLIQRAHAAGLQVSVHIETAGDFRRAVAAGADYIAHLPGWQVGQRAGYAEGDLSPWLLTETDATAAAASGAVVLTTANKTTASQDVHRHNVQLLRNAGVTLIIGSDSFGEPGILNEIQTLDRLDVYSRPDLMRMALQDTAAIIFPERRLGRLEEGYEASFLVLDQNPMEDLQRLAAPALRVKQGLVLSPPPALAEDGEE